MSTEVLAEEVTSTRLKYYEAVIPPVLDYQVSLDSNYIVKNRFREPNRAPLGPQEVQEIAPFKYDSPLDRTGFVVQNQINSFLGIYRKSVEAGLIHEQALTHSLAEIEMNIRGYTVEYSKQGLVLPHLIALEGEKLVNSYNHQPIIPHISAEERGGSVLSASIDIQEFLGRIKQGTAVTASPMGKSGIRGKDGSELEYFVTQTFIYTKSSGFFEGVTLVTDMTESQNRELMLRLGIVSSRLGGKTEGEKVENIVRNPALLTPFLGRSLPPEEVMEMILDIRGEGDIRLVNTKGQIEYRPVAEMRRDLAHRAELLKFNTACEGFIDEFKRMVLENGHGLNSREVQWKIAVKLEETIFRMTREVDPEKGGGVFRSWADYPLIRENLYQEFAREIASLETRVGCAGSERSRSVLGGYLMGVANPNLEAKHCLFCGEVNICGKDKCHACKGILVI